MKKILLGLLIVAMAVSLTSCSQEVYSKLGGFMGKMGGNVYGIEPNMADVEKATSSVDASVSEDGSVDLAVAAKITDSVADIKGSSSKETALKAELAKPVTTNAEQAQKIQENLRKELVGEGGTGGLKAELDALLASAPENQKQLVQEVSDALEEISGSISANPTKADVATVAVLVQVADAVKNVVDGSVELVNAGGSLTPAGMALADQALSSLDTLKITTEVAGIDVLGGMSLSSLIDSAFGDSSKGIGEDDLNKAKLFVPVIQKFINAVSKDGGFNEAKFNALVSQSKAVKAVYDALSLPYNDKSVSEILSSDINHGMTADDMVMYLVVSAFSEFSDYLKTVISTNYETLSDLKNFTADSTFDFCETELDAAKAKLSSYIGSDDFEKILDIQNVEPSSLSKEGKSFFRTLAFLVRDAELTGILEFVQEQLAEN